MVSAVPPQVLRKSNASNDLLAMLLTTKYVDGLPLAPFDYVLGRAAADAGALGHRYGPGVAAFGQSAAGQPAHRWCHPRLFADRTSMATTKANPLRLWFASFAYVLLESLRRLALGGTALAQATCGSVRLKLLKLGALVKISMRRVKITFASGCPCQAEWALADARLNPTPS